MKLEALKGKVIRNIFSEVKSFDYDFYNGSIPLEESNNCILLDNGEIIDLASYDEKCVSILNAIPPNLKSIFIKKTFWQDWFFNKKEEKRVIGQRITTVYTYADEIDCKRVVLGLENGYLIAEIKIAPMGTGHAGIWICKNIEELPKVILTSLEAI